MIATEILKKEHQIILSKITGALERCESDTVIDVPFWEIYVEFLKNYADSYHHAKEEDIYFKWIIAHDPSMADGPIACMLQDHENTRGIVRTMKKMVSDSDLTIEDWDTLKGLVREYARILISHIGKEDNVLYQMAEGIDSRFGDGDQEMLPQFELVEEELKHIRAKYDPS